MNIVDYIIIGIIVFTALLGLKRGVIKSVIYLAAILIVTIVAYQFKPVLANILMKVFPFIKFGGDFSGVSALNILVYQGIAFIILFLILLVILAVIIKISGILDLIVKLTFILEIPSKILGIIAGVFEGIVICFIGLYVGMQIPQLQDDIAESKLGYTVLYKTPIVNKVFKEGNDAAKNIYELIKNKIDGSEDVTDEEITESLENDGVITKDDLDNLKRDGKIIVDKIKKQIKGDSDD